MYRLVIALVLCLGISPVGARAATYDVDLSLGTALDASFAPLGEARLTGQIVTNGTLGALSPSNLSSWTFTMQVGSYSETISSAGASGTPAAFLGGIGLTVTADSILFSAARFAQDRAIFQNADLTEVSFLNFSVLATNEALNVISYRFRPASPVRSDDISLFVNRDTVIATLAPPVAAIPLPAGLALLLGALGMLALVRWRRHGNRAVA